MIKHIKRLFGIGTKPTEVKVETAPVQEATPVMPTIEIPMPAIEPVAEVVVEPIVEVAPVEVPAKPKKAPRKPAVKKAKKVTK
jgi:hypothetical protein